MRIAGESLLAASAAVNRCLDIIAATRMTIANARREDENVDIDAVVPQVQAAPDGFIPAEAKADIYRWPDAVELSPETQ